MTCEDKLWSSAHFFASQRRSSLMARRDKLWSFCTFCHPKAASPMTCGDKLWSSVHLFTIQRRSSPMARRDKLWSFCTFCHPELRRSEFLIGGYVGARASLLSATFTSSVMLTLESRDMRRYPSGCPHFQNFLVLSVRRKA